MFVTVIALKYALLVKSVINGHLGRLKTQAFSVLSFSTLAYSYLRIPYLHIPSSSTFVFRTCVFSRPSVATYGCESWTLRKKEETRLDAYEMKGLRRILWVSWAAKKTNEWVLNKAGVKRELLDTVTP